MYLRQNVRMNQNGIRNFGPLFINWIVRSCLWVSSRSCEWPLHKLVKIWTCYHFCNYKYVVLNVTKCLSCIWPVYFLAQVLCEWQRSMDVCNRCETSMEELVKQTLQAILYTIVSRHTICWKQLNLQMFIAKTIVCTNVQKRRHGSLGCLTIYRETFYTKPDTCAKGKCFLPFTDRLRNDRPLSLCDQWQYVWKYKRRYGIWTKAKVRLLSLITTRVVDGKDCCMK